MQPVTQSPVISASVFGRIAHAKRVFLNELATPAARTPIRRRYLHNPSAFLLHQSHSFLESHFLLFIFLRIFVVISTLTSVTTAFLRSSYYSYSFLLIHFYTSSSTSSSSSYSSLNSSTKSLLHLRLNPFFALRVPPAVFVRRQQLRTDVALVFFFLLLALAFALTFLLLRGRGRSCVCVRVPAWLVSGKQERHVDEEVDVMLVTRKRIAQPKVFFAREYESVSSIFYYSLTKRTAATLLLSVENYKCI